MSASSNHRAVQIVELVSNSQFRAKKKELQEIYGDDRVADLPLMVLCIAGAARKGKSFILNFFLDYLYHKENHPNEPWQLKNDTRLTGFEFREGRKPTTMGIWAWSHIFIIEKNDGTKVAVSLIDSQGTFDNKTTYQGSSTIFAMTSMFSSVMCFNLFNDLQEDTLDSLAAFVDYANVIVDNLGGNGKLFQSFAVIVRDCNYAEYLDDENGGQIFLEEILHDVEAPEQQSRNTLNASYERKFGFVFPHPGEIVAKKKTSNIADMNPQFVIRAKRMVEALLSPSELQIKHVGPTVMYCKDMCDYILKCVKCFNENQEFAPRAVQSVNRDFMINLEVKRASDAYDGLMNKAFVDCKVGYDFDKLLSLHTKIFDQIQDEIPKRIKNEEVVIEVLEKSGDQMKNSFLRYKEKNELLREAEKEKKEAAEKLAKEKMEHENRQRELYEQGERERRQHEKELAEAAEKMAKEKERQAELQRKHEIEQQRQRDEADKQRILEQRKHEEEMQRIKLETEQIAKEKLERENESRRIQKENDQKIAAIEERSRKEREEYERKQKEANKGFFSKVAEGVCDGMSVSADLANATYKETDSVFLGHVVCASTVLFTAAGGAVVGVGKGLGKVFETIFS